MALSRCTPVSALNGGSELLASLSVGWLVFWLGCLLAGLSVCWTVCWAVCWLVGLLASLSVGWLVCWLVGLLGGIVCQLVCLSVDL